LRRWLGYGAVPFTIGQTLLPLWIAASLAASLAPWVVACGAAVLLLPTPCRVTSRVLEPLAPADLSGETEEARIEHLHERVFGRLSGALATMEHDVA
jgi:hypothetical protein